MVPNHTDRCRTPDTPFMPTYSRLMPSDKYSVTRARNGTSRTRRSASEKCSSQAVSRRTMPPRPVQAMTSA